MEQNTEAKKPFPTFLMTLCIISLVAIGITSLSDLMFMITKAMPEEQIKEAMEMSKQLMEQSQPGSSEAADINLMYRAIDNSPFHLLFNLIELTGVIMLLMRRKMGLHFYIASQIGIAYVAYITFGAAGMSQIMMCFIWAYMYWMACKKLD